jgi:hypothetical protein
VTDPGWLEEIRAAAVALGTRITVLPPHGSDAEPVELDGRPGADNTWGALLGPMLGAGPPHDGTPYEHRHMLPETEEQMDAPPDPPLMTVDRAP